jgi:hypothetical protein
LIITNIICGLAVNPRPTEETRPFTFLLADNFATVDTVVNQIMSSALTVAYLPPGHQELRHILNDLFVLATFRPLLLRFPFSARLLLYTFDLLFVFAQILNPLNELGIELLRLFLCEIKQVTQLNVDRREIFFHQILSK